MPSKINGYSTSQPLAPSKGSSPGAAADKAQADASGSAAAAQTGDQVTLTTSARSLQKLSDAIAQAPVVDSAKVAAIKQSIAAGTYQVDAASVANKMLQFETGMK